jgi:hypothetical protein
MAGPAEWPTHLVGGLECLVETTGAFGLALGTAVASTNAGPEQQRVAGGPGSTWCTRQPPTSNVAVTRCYMWQLLD